MSSAASGQPPSLTQIPTDRVVRLVGLTDEQLAVSLDPLPTGVPVVIRHSIGRHGQSQHDVVDEALAELEAMAANLYPAWLPDAGEMATSSDFDVRVVRELAHRHAAHSAHFGPFLADLAQAAQRGRAPERTFAPDVRATGLSRIIADSYRRPASCCWVGPAAAPSATTTRAMTSATSPQHSSGWQVTASACGCWLASCRS